MLENKCHVTHDAGIIICECEPQSSCHCFNLINVILLNKYAVYSIYRCIQVYTQDRGITLSEADTQVKYVRMVRSSTIVLCMYIKLTNDMIIGYLDDIEHAQIIRIGLSSDVDSLHHNILISRLISIGFNGAALKWLISYLSDRTYSIYILKVFIHQMNL